MMTRLLQAIAGVMLLVLGTGGSVASTIEQRDQSRLLAPIPGGLWEIVRTGGDKSPRRVCVRDVSVLAQYEHLGRQCTRVTISESNKVALIRYTCTAGGFGSSEVEVVTPRNLRIETQGIKDGRPFFRNLQARRTGTC